MSRLIMYKECLESCSICSAICYKTAMTLCRPAGLKTVEPKHFGLLLSCAKNCATFAGLLLSRSDFSQELCIICAETCAACAEICEHVDGMDECVAACRKCAESCRKMAA